MNIVYLGTPDFSVEPLKNILDNGYNVLAVITNRDKPVGRKQILTACPVATFAESKGIEVYKYDKIRLEGVEDLKALNPDLMITCAFGQILSKEILDIPKYGVINIHASLLPKYRGASPIHYAILNGESETGITIMKTEEGIDTGDIILQKAIKIGEKETCGELFDRLSNVGAELIIDAIKAIENGTATYIKQDENKATLTKMVKKQDALIDFNTDAKSVVNKIRAYNPAPVAYTFLNGQIFKIYSAVVGEGKGNPGEVINNENHIEIACSKGSIILEKVQKAGGNALDIKDFLRGNKIQIGFNFNG